MIYTGVFVCVRVCGCVHEASIVFFGEHVPVSDTEPYSPGGRGMSQYASPVMAGQPGAPS